jgi:hypothetical protein
MIPETSKPTSNPLFRLLIWNWLAGAVAAVTLLGGLLATNAMHLRDLIFSSDSPVVPIAMLFFGFLITLCSVAMGTAIMNIGAEDVPSDRGTGVDVEPDDSDLLPHHRPALAPVRVRAQNRQQRG